MQTAQPQTRPNSRLETMRAGVHERKHLISRMLSNRQVLRMLSAPCGYGKTTLAREYARSVFSSIGVLWVDGTSPSLLCELDDRSFPTSPPDFEGPMRLLVIDDLPTLDHSRSQVLSAAINRLLRKHCEVIICAVPSNDCLSTLQPDRVCLTARDLSVSSSELNIDGIHRKDRLLPFSVPSLQGVPSLIWGETCTASASCIVGFLTEKMPSEFKLPAICMALLAQGSIEDIRQLDVRFTSEAQGFLGKNYPLFGLNMHRQVFSTIPIAVPDLSGAEAFMPAGWREPGGFVEQIMTLLCRKGNLMRAADVADTFLDAQRKGRWACAHGVSLLDQIHPAPLLRLIDSTCAAGHDSDSIRALDIWASCISGDIVRAAGVAAHATMPDSMHMSRHALFAAACLCPPKGQDSHGNAPGMPRHMPRNTAAYDAAALCGFLDGIPYRPGATASEDSLLAAWLFLLAGAGAKPDATNRTIPHLPVSEGQLVSDLEDSSQQSSSPVWRLALHAAFLWLALQGDSAYAGLRERVTDLLMQVVEPLTLTRNTTVSGSLLIIDASETHDGTHRIIGLRRAIRSAQEMVAALFESLGNKGLKCIHEMGAPICALIDPLLSTGFDPVPRLSGLITPSAPPQLSSPMHEGITAPTIVVPPEIGSGAHVVLDAASRPLYIRMLGGLEVFDNGEVVSNSFLRKKQVRWLLAELVLHKGREISRAQLESGMWPNLSEERQRANFYVVWRYLKQALRIDTGSREFICKTETTLKINLELVDSDIYQLEHLQLQLLSRRNSEMELMRIFMKVERLYRGDLLVSEFEDARFDVMRSWYREMYVDTMVNASTRAADAGQGYVALYFARKAFEHGVSREDVYRALMRAQMLTGQNTGAVSTYRQCEVFLRNEMGVEPSTLTREMYNRLIQPT